MMVLIAIVGVVLYRHRSASLSKSNNVAPPNVVVVPNSGMIVETSFVFVKMTCFLCKDSNYARVQINEPAYGETSLDAAQQNEPNYGATSLSSI